MVSKMRQRGRHEGKKGKVAPESLPRANPFEKVKVEDFNDNYSLIAYLFAKPEQNIYNRLVGRENLILVGGWGSGKTMLLKYLGLETQIEVGVDNAKSLDFVGVYVKTGRGAIKPFLKPGGEFKEGGEALFGHYFNLLVLENIVSVILYGRKKGVFSISAEEEKALYQRVVSEFSFVQQKPSIGFRPSREEADLRGIKDEVAVYRREVETFLNIRDLEKDLSYRDQLGIQPTNIRTFLDEVIKGVKETISNLSQKRFYILLDECELLSKGQQKVVNTLIKQRLPTMTFKLATRPPDIQTMGTIDEGIGLTDREIEHLYLDKEYDPTTASFKRLCKEIARKRLEKYGYQITDMRRILGTYDPETEVGKDEIISYLKRNYPTKARTSDEGKFKTVYKDFKVAALFQILKEGRLSKKYAGFDMFVMLSTGIILHFLELCRDTFSLSFGRKDIVPDQSGKMIFKRLPLETEIQDKAANSVSGDFYRDIMGRADSLKAPPLDMEFGGKIQYISSVLGGVFREKLMGFNEPEAARIEIPEGLSALDDSPSNPIRQLFTTAIAISVFQEYNPYLPQHLGEIKPPTYILNRILAPYYKISPRPRWRTQIPAEVFNKILKAGNGEFKNEVLRKRKKKREAVEEVKRAGSVPEAQFALPFSHLPETMPVLSYLSNKTESECFAGKTLLILLHFLGDLIPFVEACRKAGASPTNTLIFCKDYLYPNKEEIKSYLGKGGYKVYSVKEIDVALKELNSEGTDEIIIIEDGGIIVPRVHRAFGDLVTATLGAVEQTTKGIRNDEQVKELSFPVISIPGSKLKDTFEPPHVARAVVNAIRRLLADRDLSGRNALVLGYGNIGEHIALQLRDTLGMKVSICDLDPAKLLKAQQYGFDAEESLRESVKQKFLIIGATGETAIGRSEVLAMEHNVYLISASSEQWEFCLSELEALSSEKGDLLGHGEKTGTRYKIRNTEKYVNLVADGYPINFWKTESMPNEASDLIMSLIFVSSVEVASNVSLVSGINHEIANKLAERYELGRIYLEYHK